jgi:hypothetical protein
MGSNDRQTLGLAQLPKTCLRLFGGQQHAGIKRALHSPDVAGVLCLSQGQGAPLQRQAVCCSSAVLARATAC